MAAGAERLKDFRIKNLLGKGAFGDVYKVQRISDGKTYALKKINIASMDTREVGDTLNEIRSVFATLSRLFHVILRGNPQVPCVHSPPKRRGLHGGLPEREELGNLRGDGIC
jgi:serine/threonine protein kinase